MKHALQDKLKVKGFNMGIDLGINNIRRTNNYRNFIKMLEHEECLKTI